MRGSPKTVAVTWHLGAISGQCDPLRLLVSQERPVCVCLLNVSPIEQRLVRLQITNMRAASMILLIWLDTFLTALMCVCVYIYK